MFDILIKDGKVIDGTGRSAYQADFSLPILPTADSLLLGCRLRKRSSLG